MRLSTVFLHSVTFRISILSVKFVYFQFVFKKIYFPKKFVIPERSMIFDFIKNHEKIFPIEKMCQVLEVSSSGYYRCISSKTSIKLQRIIAIKKNNSNLF